MEKLSPNTQVDLKKYFAPDVIQLWGEDNLKEIMTLVQDPLHDEITEVLFSAGLSPEEQMSYLEASPDVIKIRSRLLEIEDELVKKLLPSLEKSLKKLVKAFQTGADPRPAMKDYVHHFDYPNPFVAFCKRGTHFRNMRILEFVGGVMNRLIFETTMKLKDWNISGRALTEIDKLLNGLFALLTKANGVNYLEKSLTRFSFKNYSALDKNPAVLEETLLNEPEYTDEEIDLMAMEADELLSRRKKSFTQPVRHGKFIFTPNPADDTMEQVFDTCKAALLLDEKQTYAAPKHRGKGVVEYQQNAGALEFTAEKLKGDLLVPLTHHSLELMFEKYPKYKDKSKNLYAKLRAFFYKSLIEFLNTLPEDPLPIKVEPAREIQNEVHQAVEEVQQEVEELEAVEIPVESPKEIPEEAVAEKEGRISFRECAGFKSGLVKQVLSNILGEPIRVVGSHHIFKGPNGKTFPIPFHGQQNVSPKILRNGIEMWGITSEWRKAMKI